MKKACEYHDYGKCNEDFQNRLKNKTKFDDSVEIPHNVLSAFFINSKQFEKDDYPIIFNAVLNHHFYENNLNMVIFEKDRIVEKLKDYEYFKPKKSVTGKLDATRISVLGILIKGLLHKCDYSASAGIDIEFENDFLVDSMERLLKTWNDAGISSCYNEMQLFCEKHHDENIIITAPTGMGKTEASLLWLQNCKGFYILPIRTAINCIYDRIATNILQDINITERISLLHSNNAAFIMDKYQDMDIFEYLTYSKNLSIPLTVSTPDQIFNFVFRYKGYELKLAVLSYSKIIIDEIQAYTPELLAYIIYGIHEIVRMGGKFAIFTATLPPYVLHLLNIPYKKSGEEGTYVFKDFTHNQLRHNVKIINDKIDASYICNIFTENDKNESNKTLIVCNTVKKSQLIYQQLKEVYGAGKVKLLHSKYVKKDRAYLEKEILLDGETKTKKAVIWITTQIVEASIDIDFDYIFTELSDLNSVFQRLGRCNRKGSKSVDSYNSYIFTEIDKNIIFNKSAPRGSRGFIDEDIYELSKLALQEVDGILDELTKNKLLNDFFTYENMANSAFVRDYKYYYDYLENLNVDDKNLENVDKKIRNILSVSVIPQVIYEEFKGEILKQTKILNKSFDSKNTTISKNEFLLEKEKAKQYINSLCVDVYPYDFKQEQVLDIVKFGRFNEIKVVECDYNDLGYKKIVNNEQTGGEGEFL